jgi:30S ribosomal protein S31
MKGFSSTYHYVFCQLLPIIRLKPVKIMGKGDRKTKKGKINKGTYGVRRPKKQTVKEVASAAKKTAKPKAKATKAKKPAAKKTEATKEVKEEKAEKTSE